LRITRLVAENIKRLKAIDLNPNDHINRISGGNGSGKTSALDSIEWALTGTSTVPKQPVRKGAGRALIQLDLGDIIVTRRFTEGGPRNGSLIVESKSDRSTFKSPQDMLDKFMGKISFDPLEFLRMKPEQQSMVLRSLVKLEIDLDELDKAYQADYLRRREAKKEKLAVETRRDAVYVAPDLPKDKVDEAVLVQQLTEASSFNANIERLQRERDDYNENIAILARDIDDQRAKIAELRAEADRLEEEADGWFETHEKNVRERQKWKPLPELRDAAALAEEITKARTVNQGIDRRAMRDGYQNEADVLSVEIDNLSEALDDRERVKAEAMAKAEFPVQGLAFGEDEVIYNGFPFGQISNAEQIRCSVAIGMASNPELRVMRIKDGSLLDEDAMKVLAEMAEAHDFQVFLECVDTSGKVGVYLEDGEVTAINPEPLNDAKKEEKKPSASKKRTKVQA
jgi:DNA repair exonuclease SbcCD ATPase subunit